MYRHQTVGVVVPCYNEESQIESVIRTMPAWIDRIYAVDDCSADDTIGELERIAAQDERVKVLRHDVNKGVGAAIGTGYIAAVEEQTQLVAVMAGDGQMDPDDLPGLLDPIVDGRVDYNKGNRFLYQDGLRRIPRVRLFGNFVLSAMTKLSSGYWHLSDSQCGYTAASLHALRSIDNAAIYPRYGCPNDILTKLNIAHIRVGEMPVAPLYNVGEISKLKIHKVIFPILRLLAHNFASRLFYKYVVRSAHPLVLAYLGAAVAFAGFLTLGGYIGVKFAMTGIIPKTALILAGFSMVGALQLFVSAIEMDYNDNSPLQVFLGTQGRDIPGPEAAMARPAAVSTRRESPPVPDAPA